MSDTTSQTGPASAVAILRDADYDIYCPQCGYNLRGVEHERCAECGLELDFIEGGRRIIPWERRGEIGRLRAFFATVWMATRAPRRLSWAAYQPLDWKAALRFRTIAVVLASLAIVAWWAVYRVFFKEGPEQIEEMFGWGFYPTTFLGMLLGLAIYTGLPTYAFIVRKQTAEAQNRALTIAQYGAGPLVWLVPLVGVLAAVFPIMNEQYSIVIWIALSVGVLLFVHGLVDWSWSRLAIGVRMSGMRRLMLAWVFAPTTFVIAYVIGALIPVLSGYFYLIYLSLATVPAEPPPLN